MRTLIGIVTFGNLPFTKLTVEEIRRNAERGTRIPNLFVIVGKPGDHETKAWLDEQEIPNMLHDVNRGFPASLNDIFDYAWTGETRNAERGTRSEPSTINSQPSTGPYDNVILCGNDVLPYPGAIEALIECAATTDWEWICSSMFDVQTLCRMYPEAGKFFKGDSYIFEPAAAEDSRAPRPWDLHAAHVAATPKGVEAHQFKDVQNLCLYKRSVFEKLGYFDANFWPNGYYSDNDYARRAVNAGLRGCGLPHSQYFHFWSRTIHQGETSRPHGKYFGQNDLFYQAKWMGGFGREKFSVPFGGQPFPLPERGTRNAERGTRNGPVLLPGSLKIPDRKDEAAIIEYWSSL